ncbi:3-oxoacyl-ACP synthase III family protein [Streptomyces sp. NPDC053048]|uniref:3-oxoacyl-ACP synthase III family protein n=1 Tax=Streptomyces sp. NPDC053048 TaxID=3365694 RepID=UPI0037D174D0
MSTEALEDLIARDSPQFDVPRGMIRRMTGVDRRYIRADGWTASDFAVAASGKALAEAGLGPGDLDLLIFSAVSTDLLEPATAHVVAAGLGAGCPVFDVKNACNSLLNALEIGDSFIRSGAYRRILVCCGETLTYALRTGVSGPREFLDAMVGYTVSDVGAAVVLEASDEPGIIGCSMRAISAEWAAGAVPVPGARAPRQCRQRFDLAGMRRAVHRAVGEGDLSWLVAGTGLRPEDASLCCAHLAADLLADDFCDVFGVPRSRLVTTIASHGNTGSATLPLQLETSLREGRLRRGDVVLLVGLASGIGLGALWLRL